MNTNCPNTCATCPLRATCNSPRNRPALRDDCKPCFTLENRDGFWELTSGDHMAVLPQNHVWFFVAVLLNNESAQSLSVRELSRKVFATFGAHPDFIYGGARWLRLHLDESELAQILRLRQEALERLLDRNNELEIIKHE